MSSEKYDFWWEEEESRPGWAWLPAVLIPVGVLAYILIRLWGAR